MEKSTTKYLTPQQRATQKHEEKHKKITLRLTLEEFEILRDKALSVGAKPIRLATEIVKLAIKS